MANTNTLLLQLIAGGAEAGLEDANGYSPLVRAVLCGHRAVVQALALSGVDLNHYIQSGATAAHVSSYSLHVEQICLQVEFLLSIGTPSLRTLPYWDSLYWSTPLSDSFVLF